MLNGHVCSASVITARTTQAYNTTKSYSRIGDEQRSKYVHWVIVEFSVHTMNRKLYHYPANALYLPVCLRGFQQRQFELQLSDKQGARFLPQLVIFLALRCSVQYTCVKSTDKKILYQCK